MPSWLLAIWIHTLFVLPNPAADRIPFAPGSGVLHIGYPAFLPEPHIRDKYTGEARHTASGVFPFADDLPDESNSTLIINRIPSGQSGVIRFRHPELTVFACAENPRRPAKIFTQQPAKAFSDAIALWLNELMNSGR
jgi:hypothetical protein